MTADDAEFARRTARLAGEIAVLGMAVQAALKFHPRGAEVAAELHRSYESVTARALAEPFPDAFLDGMKAAIELFLSPSTAVTQY